MKTQMQRLIVITCLTAAAFFAFSGAARAQDLITLQDGTVLEGRVLYIEHNYLLVTTPILDNLSIEIWMVKSIETAAPMHVLTYESEWITGPIKTTTDGKMQTHPVDGGDPIDLQWWMVAGVFPTRVRWANSLTLGGSFTQGNTDVLGFSFSGAGTRKGEENRFLWSGSFTWARAEGRTVAENAKARFKFDRLLRPRLYWWVAEELRYDKFQDLDIRSVTSGGLGYILVWGPTTEMSVEAGVGFMAERFERETDENNLAFRGSWNWEQLIGRNATFTNLFVTYLGDESVKFQFTNQAEFKIDLSRTWAFKVTNGWYYDAEPSTFIGHNSDVEWVVGFEYVF